MASVSVWKRKQTSLGASSRFRAFEMGGGDGVGWVRRVSVTVSVVLVRWSAMRQASGARTTIQRAEYLGNNGGMESGKAVERAWDSPCPGEPKEKP